MSRFYSYLNTASEIIQHYDGGTPLAIFLKKFFNQNKKMGSKDRKQVASLVYNFYRISKMLAHENLEESLLIATFLCEYKSSNLLEHIRPEWNAQIAINIEQKIEIIGNKININNLFPFKNALSKSIDAEVFSQSFLNQPKLFVRIRPGFKDKVLEKLKGSNICFDLISPSCLALANGTKIDEILSVGNEVIIQDFSSQMVGGILKEYVQNKNNPISIWDCCAASGGKSIMLHDLNPQINLTVSDVRQSIIENLKERFTKAAIINYKSKIIDLNNATNFTEKYDIILADVPCTGSGTWARTPEQMHFFHENSISKFADLQYNIIKNTLPNLKKDGILVYITCSIFEKENEIQVVNIMKDFNLNLIDKTYLFGYNKAADSMFVAVLQK
jgi:16S rRNA (cytosine967-C5)-methyltransferase